jgi:hypothetical protein
VIRAMPLKLLEKSCALGGQIASFGNLILAAISLAGCISSAAPILTDSRPILGDRGQIHVYRLSEGVAHEPSTVSFRWNGSRYLLRGKAIGNGDVTLHAYEGRDFIVQSTTARPPHSVEYALARRLADGVYLIVPIDEADAEETVQQKFCVKTQAAACRVASPEQLFVFARATADKGSGAGGLAVIVPDTGAKH